MLENGFQVQNEEKKPRQIEAETLLPPLTTVRVLAEQVGRNLAELVLNRRDQPHLPPPQRIVPTQIISTRSFRPLQISFAKK
jgi:DNA-binding LacI/PurR family transcriptional regulator